MLILFLKYLVFLICFHFEFVLSIDSTPPLAIDSKTREIISEINNNRCVAAESLIKASNYTDRIPTIVREVYSASEQKIPLILKCVKSLDSIGLSYKMLKSLRDEMKSRGHAKPLDLINLVYALQKEILHQVNRTTSKVEAQILVDEIIPDIEKSSLNILKPAMIDNNFKYVPEILNLTSELFDFRDSLSDSIMLRLVNETFGKISAIDMADNIYYGCVKISQIITGLLSLYGCLSNTGDTNNDAVLRIAKYIKLLRVMPGYGRLSKKKKLAVNAMIDKLPKCAKNLYFAKDLCFINKNVDEHLYASDAQFYFTRRSIFTYALNAIDSDGIWHVEEIDGYYYFKSLAHFNEYLYTSTRDRYQGTGNRYVQTWMDDGFLGETSAWSIELDGDWCFFKNVNFNEYMFASTARHGKRRFIFTTKSKGTGSYRGAYQWQIRNCG